MSDQNHRSVTGFTGKSEEANLTRSVAPSIGKSFITKTADFSSVSSSSLYSDDTANVLSKIQELESGFSNQPPISSLGAGLGEQLFDARANVKILVSQVSMHLSNELRERLFQQIDLLHDPDEWEDGDEPIHLKSFKTFLRWFYLNNPKNLPSFGLSSRGNFITSWMANNNNDRLILEFLPDDRVKWFITKQFEDGSDNVTGTTMLNRISKMLRPFKPEEWFGN